MPKSKPSSSASRDPKKAGKPAKKKIKFSTHSSSKTANKQRLKPKQKLDKVRETLDVAIRAGAGATQSEGGVMAIVPANKTVADALETHISIDYAIEVLKEQMKAETEFYDLTARKLIKRPDGKTRLAAVELFLAYKEGRPVERKIIEHHNLDSMEDLEKKLASSPALCETFMAMILKAQSLREIKA